MFDKKFDFFPHVLGYFACTGCGRCIEACPGDIDIREAMKGLVNGSWNKPPHR
jgi:predicted aldo/keto reductase-like oxidoreductase